METLYSYYIWQPHLTSEGELIVTVTPGESSELGTLDQVFLEKVVRAMQLDAPLAAGEVLPFRSTYHGDPDTKDWRDRWPKNWRLRLRLSAKVARVPRFKHESIGLEALPEGVADVPTELGLIACIIFSDFKRDSAADKARASLLASKKLEKLRSTLQLPRLSFERVPLGSGLRQEQIFLGSVSRDALEAGFPYGVEIERVCRASGGMCNFEERIGKWDELYDETGI